MLKYMGEERKVATQRAMGRAQYGSHSTENARKLYVRRKFAKRPQWQNSGSKHHGKAPHGQSTRDEAPQANSCSARKQYSTRTAEEKPRVALNDARGGFDVKGKHIDWSASVTRGMLEKSPSIHRIPFSQINMGRLVARGVAANGPILFPGSRRRSTANPQNRPHVLLI